MRLVIISTRKYVLVGIILIVGVISIYWTIILSSRADPDIGRNSTDIIPQSELLNRSIPAQLSANNKSTDTILLITLDTTRTDHLSAYNYPKTTTPFLNKLVKNGVRFDRAYAPMSTTAPSHATILSSLYPIQHRIVKNGLKMPADITTMPELLKQAGYKTAAFVSTNRHFGTSRIAQGFEHYNDPEPNEQRIAINDGSDSYNIRYRPGKKTVKKAKKWLIQQDDSKKNFIWLHLFDPHAPYVNRMKYRKAMTRNTKSGVKEWVDYIHKNHHLNLLSKKSKKNNYLDRHRNYDAEIRYMDKAVKMFVQFVYSTIDKNPLIVVAGDHGEGLGSHNWWQHGKNIYNEQIRIPLIINFPDNQYAGEKVDKAVELNDVMPTILRETNIPQSILTNRKKPIEGAPLQNLLTNKETNFHYAFVQRRQFADHNWNRYYSYQISKHLFKPVNPIPKYHENINYEPGNKYALVGDQYKYIYSTANRDEAYNIKHDFYEQNNLVTQLEPGDRISQLGQTVKVFVGSLKNKHTQQKEAVDSKTKDKLRGLGYFD